MDENFTLDELKLAFSYHIVNQILGADGVVAPMESRFLKRTFPAQLFERAAFLDSSGRFTRRWHDALGEALLALPEQPVPERLALIRTFFEAAIADDDFQVGEASVMKRAARLLGLAEHQYADILDRLVTSEVELESSED